MSTFDIKIVNATLLSQHLSELVSLCDGFLKALDIYSPREHSDKEEVLRKMVAQSPPTYLIAALNENGKPVGMSYFNTGSGYACGGDYLWLNGIYVSPDYRKKECGKAILGWIESWAKSKGITQIVSSRDSSNQASKQLFSSLAFEQSDNVWIIKHLERR